MGGVWDSAEGGQVRELMLQLNSVCIYCTPAVCPWIHKVSQHRENEKQSFSLQGAYRMIVWFQKAASLWEGTDSRCCCRSHRKLTNNSSAERSAIRACLGACMCCNLQHQPTPATLEWLSQGLIMIFRAVEWSFPEDKNHSLALASKSFIPPWEDHCTQ